MYQKETMQYFIFLSKMLSIFNKKQRTSFTEVAKIYGKGESLTV